MEKFIQANGCTVRISDTEQPRKYEKADKKENTSSTPEYQTIVLLHGYLSNIDGWADFIPLLEDHARVIAIDLPAERTLKIKGETYTMEFLADTVHATLCELGIEKCIFCGHSMGGYITLELLRKYPEMVKGVIMLHSTPFADTPEKKTNRKREIEIVLAGKKDLLAVSSFEVFAPQNRNRFAKHIEESAERTRLTDDADIIGLLRGMIERNDNNATLKESSVAQMFVFGRNDEYIPVKTAEEVIRLQPQARIVWLENSGHMGAIEEPENTAEAILSFVRSIN